jgi:hypothetical protein
MHWSRIIDVQQSRREIEALAKDPSESVAPKHHAMNTLPVTVLARYRVSLVTVFSKFSATKDRSRCKNLYPTNPSAVDEVLCEGIRARFARSGVLNVMISGGKLPPQDGPTSSWRRDRWSRFKGRIVTESTFDGPVIPMGVLDPLNDARDRAIRFGALRRNFY